MYEEITAQARQAVTELVDAAGLRAGELLVIGCSSSEMVGARIGKGSSMEAAQAALDGIWPVVQERGIYLAAQCCEHLNRALILDEAAVEHIRARAGIDIGGTLIGMHLKEVAVPVRLSVSRIGEAPIICARTRPRFIGGERARYQEELK